MAVAQAIWNKSWLSYVVGELLLSRIIPSGIFLYLAMGRGSGLMRQLQVTRLDDAQLLPLIANVLQGILTIFFLAIIVVLFMVRRPIIGRRSSLSGGLVALAGTFVLMAPVGAEVDEGNTVALLISSGLVLAGISLSVVSLLSLGRCFGLMPEARGLVTYGPYAWVRHPLYVGETISAMGLAVGAASLPLAGLMIVYCGLQYWRAVNEEKALEDAFPEYAEYRCRTARFLPGVC